MIKNFDNSMHEILMTHIRITTKNNKNFVKLVLDRNEKVLYLSRLDIPYEFEKTTLFKQLGLIAFKNNILEKFIISKKQL